MTKAKIAGLIACCGLAAPVVAQPTLVNISGATLLESFLTSPASANDFSDLDGDGLCGNCPSPNDFAESLTGPGTTVGGALGGDFFVIQYTAVGSGNGIADLDARGVCAVDAFGNFVDGESNYVRGFDDQNDTKPDNPFSGLPGSPGLVGVDGYTANNVSLSFLNGFQYNNGGTLTAPPANPSNPRAYPLRSLTDGSYTAVNSTDDFTAGIQIDLAPTDVPIAWFIEQAGTPDFTDVPNGPGYGTNPIQGVSLDGSMDVRDNSLRTLTTTNTNTTNPDQCTIFDNALTLAPVGALVSYGVGISEIDASDLRHGLVTGRLPSGENLVFATRDSGSGTRNGFMNGICLDPSWGMGDNVGARQSSSSNDNLGPNWQPTNLGGSSRMDAVVLDSRLAIGHTGAERLNRYKTSNNGTGGLDMLAIENDTASGYDEAIATANRPFIDNILDNDANNGYIVIGPGNIASIGTPNSINPGDPEYMENQAAADYLRNINESVAAFANVPGTDTTIFSPGEFLAFRFIPNGAADFVAGPGGACDLVVPGNFNQSLQDFVRANSALGADEFEFFDFTATGDAPSRDTSFVYADGLSNSYVSEAGSIVAYGSQLDMRNKISGDFNADLERDINDIADLVGAYEEREGGASWTPPSGMAGPSGDFVLDIVGDFNGDGSFDVIDVRYFLDGLAIDPSTGDLDRHLGFVLADNASASGNVFGTTLATGAAYTAGASAADVAGAAGTTPGFHPIGADNIIDGADLDYILLQFADLGDRELDWEDTAECAIPRRDGGRRDLSADVDGDLDVDFDDLCKALDFLGSEYGDVNLDGVANGADLAIINSNSGQAGGWADGDINGDGIVNGNDVEDFNNLNPCDGGGENRLCGDVNDDGAVSDSDFFAWVTAFIASPPSAADLVACDVNDDGSCNDSDFFAWVTEFIAAPGDRSFCPDIP
ncbi:MAG: dockerin type I domain-containing protein [Planctomycetota bacterium]